MIISDILDTKGRDVKSVASDSRLRAAMALMHQGGIGSIVVLDESGKGTLGLISQTEILEAFARLGAGALDAPIRSVMGDALYCAAGDSVEAIMARMTSTKNRHAIVVDERGRIEGIVSIGDLVASRMNELTTESMVLRDLARSRLLSA